MKNNKPSLQDQILVRYKTDGHLRFELPAELCGEQAARYLEERLGEMEGIYRVIVYRRSRKLSVRYLSDTCDLKQIAALLFELVDNVGRRFSASAGTATEARRSKGIFERILELPLAQNVKEKVRQAKAFADMFTKVTRAKLGKQDAPPMSTERFVINFLNDLVSFYLIKMHWRHITREWLKDPIRYRYQWLTVFYLVFLLVRYRKSTPKKPQ